MQNRPHSENKIFRGSNEQKDTNQTKHDTDKDLDKVAQSGHRMYMDGEVHVDQQKTKEKVEMVVQNGKAINDKLLASYLMHQASSAFWARFFKISQSEFKGSLNKDQKKLARTGMCLGDAFQCYFDLARIHSTISSDAKKRKKLFEKRSNWIDHLIESLLRLYGSAKLKVEQSNTVLDVDTRAQRNKLKEQIKNGTKSMKLHPIVEGPLLILEERLSCLPPSMCEDLFSAFPDLRYIRDAVSVMVVTKAPPVLMMLSLTVTIAQAIHSMCMDNLIKEKKEKTGTYAYMEYILPCWHCLRGSCWSALIKEFNVDATDASVFKQLCVGSCRIALGDERRSQMVDPLRKSADKTRQRKSGSFSQMRNSKLLGAVPEEHSRSARSLSLSSPHNRVLSNSLSVGPQLAPDIPSIDDDTHTSGWEKATTPDGKVYYLNRKTNETSWEVPTALMPKSPSYGADGFDF